MDIPSPGWGPFAFRGVKTFGLAQLQLLHVDDNLHVLIKLEKEAMTLQQKGRMSTTASQSSRYQCSVLKRLLDSILDGARQWKQFHGIEDQAVLELSFVFHVHLLEELG